MRRGREPKRLGAALMAWLDEERRKRRRRGGDLQEVWAAAAGEQIAAHTRVLDIRQMVMRVQVDSSALLSELVGVHRDRILRALRGAERPLMVRDLRFELGS
jgi:hypothetical protein